MLIFIALMMMMMMVEQLEHTQPPFKCKIGYQVLSPKVMDLPLSFVDVT